MYRIEQGMFNTLNSVQSEFQRYYFSHLFITVEKELTECTAI